MFVEHCQKDTGVLPGEEGDLIREKQGHARRELSQQLVDGGCGRQAGEREKVDREANKE